MLNVERYNYIRWPEDVWLYSNSVKFQGNTVSMAFPLTLYIHARGQKYPSQSSSSSFVFPPHLRPRPQLVQHLQHSGLNWIRSAQTTYPSCNVDQHSSDIYTKSQNKSNINYGLILAEIIVFSIISVFYCSIYMCSINYVMETMFPLPLKSLICEILLVCWALLFI